MNFGTCVLVRVFLMHSFVLKLVCCCWSVGVTCVHVVYVCVVPCIMICVYIRVVHDGTCVSRC